MISAVTDDNVGIEHLPWDKTGEVAEDEVTKYLIVTNDNKGDWTILNVDTMYDIIIWGNSMNYYYRIVNKTHLDGHYIKEGNIMDLIKKK